MEQSSHAAKLLVLHRYRLTVRLGEALFSLQKELRTAIDNLPKITNSHRIKQLRLELTKN